MPRTAIAAAAVISVMLAAAPGAQAQEHSWACEQIPARYERENINRFSHNREMENIVKSYMLAWDASYIRKQCQAYSKGQPYEIGCLNGKRNWKEIIALIPKEYFSMDRDALRPFTEERRESRSTRNDAIDYCREVGAIPVWRK